MMDPDESRRAVDEAGRASEEALREIEEALAEFDVNERAIDERTAYEAPIARGARRVYDIAEQAGREGAREGVRDAFREMIQPNAEFESREQESEIEAEYPSFSVFNAACIMALVGAAAILLSLHGVVLSATTLAELCLSAMIGVLVRVIVVMPPWQSDR